MDKESTCGMLIQQLWIWWWFLIAIPIFYGQIVRAFLTGKSAFGLYAVTFKRVTENTNISQK